MTKHAAIGFTEWLAAMYGDQGIGVSVLCPAAVLTPILAGKEDTPEGQDAITTEQLADIVMDGLAEERFMINTHPWVLEKFAVKARDYDEYIRMLRPTIAGERPRPRRCEPCTASSSSAAGSPGCSPPRRCAARRSRWWWSTAPTTISSSRCSTRSPPACCPKATSRRRSATSCDTSATRGSSSARSSTSTSTTGSSRSTRWDATTTLSYDSLIVATGASQSYFGHDEYAVDAPGMKTIDDALELRGRIFGAFEMAELESDDAAREPWLTFAIVGAGPTGVELAGQIAELSRRALGDNFRSFDPATARIVLLDALDTVLPSYPERLRRRAQRDLERLGVEVRLGTRVVGVDETGLDLEGDRIEARTKIWAAGVQASPLGRLLADRAGAAVDRSGRVEVQPDCSLPGHPELFVVGDLMALNGLPGLAEVAMQSGHHAARTIVAPAARSRRPSPSATSTSAPWRRSRGSARW